MVKVLIVAEDSYVRAGLNAMLDIEGEIEICGRISIAEFRLGPIDLYMPDVILLDAQNPLPEDAKLKVELAASEWPILALGMDPGDIAQGWPAGISVLHNRANAEQLRAAVFALAAGLQVYGQGFGRESYVNPLVPQIEIEEPLTARETEVLQRLAEGLTNRGIAHGLGISENTVKFHVNAILQKLGAQSRTEAVVQAVRSGILPL